MAHQDSEAQYQQPVVMIQVRSESALSFGYKAGGWSHLNEVIHTFTTFVSCTGTFHTASMCVFCEEKLCICA